MLEKIPYLKIDKNEITPNGPGAYIFTYIHELFTINEIGYQIMNFISGETNIRQIIDQLKDDYNSDGIENDVFEFIDHLKDSGVIDFYE